MGTFNGLVVNDIFTVIVVTTARIVPSAANLEMIWVGPVS
jgi:hypothetical protein